MADEDFEKREREEEKDGVVVELTPEQEERFQLMRLVGEECIKESELRNLIKSKKEQIRCYDGFEPSGRMHIAQGVMKAINVNRLTKAGCRFVFLVADWFALMNNKMDGDLAKIQTVGNYMIEVWKSVGMNLEHVEFVWSSQIIAEKPNEYWSLVLDIARRNNLNRVTRCSQIMGRTQKDELSASQIFYPCMQCADVFYLKADICQLGLDQRKVNMLAREYCDVCEPKRKFKPVILSHHMLMGLTGLKMSKSDPNSAIFMEDDEQSVQMKISMAFCEEKNISNNPLLEYLKYIVLPMHGTFECSIDGSDSLKTYAKFEEAQLDFANGILKPSDLKKYIACSLNKILKPVRDHFTNDAHAKHLLEQVKTFRITK